MNNAKTIISAVLLLTLLGGVALADWDPGDGHKMHFPQLPDPNGWDVNISIDNMWDDWQCSQSGPVEDIHFWASWKGDIGNAEPSQFNWIRAQIFADMPAGDPNNPNDPNPLPYSHPYSFTSADILWEHYFYPGEFTMREAGTGQQGWFDPQPDNQQTVIAVDHDLLSVIRPLCPNLAGPHWIVPDAGGSIVDTLGGP